MQFDICVIGAGPAGYKAALLLAKGGKKVCLVEKKHSHIGGTCLNEGCIPAKNYIETAHYKERFTHFSSNGLNGEIDNIEIKTLKEKTSLLLDSLRSGLEKKLKGSGVEVLFGKATFLNEDEIILDNSKESIKADRFVIAIGSSHKEHPVLKIDKEYILSSDEIFELEELPKSLLIVGAGAIGCEFASFFSACGTKVHLMEFTPSVLPTEDKDVSDTIQREFKKRGIKVDTLATVVSYSIENGQVQVNYKDKKGDITTSSYDKVLVSIGRVPNTNGLGLEKIGVKLDDRGFIEVDKKQKTSNEKIYAIGDITPFAMLAHVAYKEAKVVAKAILEDSVEKDAVVPNVIFTTPQVGSVGKNEKELKGKSIEYIVKKLYLKSLGMPKIKGDDSGFVKLLIDKDSKILGASIVGYNATEVINEIAICINTDQTMEDINSMIIAHPTMSESFLKLVETI